MKRKVLWRISVSTSLAAEDAVTDLLGQLLGQSASSYFDIESRASLVSVYLQKEPVPRKKIRRHLKAALANLQACGLEIGAGVITIRQIRHEDWAESWKRHFRPIEIGKILLIKPSWSRRPPKKTQQVVILDPGLSFGTGQHPTTSFCLGEVTRHVQKETVGSFLDIGCGSGILAIAAAKLGFQPIFAFDFDPEAVRVARVNAQTNGVSKKIKIARGDITRFPARPAQTYDLICANLISTLLIAERKRIKGLLNQGGTLVLAGILQTEFAGVADAFAALGLTLVNTESRHEWQSGSFAFPKKV